MPVRRFTGFAPKVATEGIPARDAIGRAIWIGDRVRIMASNSAGVVVAIETADDLRQSKVGVKVPGVREPVTLAAANLRSRER